MSSIRVEKVKIATAVLCIALLSLLSACDENEDTSDQNRRAQQTIELFNYIPAGDYLTLGYGDIDALTQSDWAQQVIELIPALQLWDAKLGINIDSFHNIAMAFLPPSEDDSEEEEGLILMNSDLTADDIIAMLGEKTHFFIEKNIGDRILYISGMEFGFGFVDKNVVALGTPALVEDAILLANGKGKSLAQTKLVERYRSYLGSSDNIWIGISGIDKYLKEAATHVTMLRNFAHIEFIYFGLSAGDDITSRIILECDTEKSASKIARGLNGLLGVMGTLVDMQELQIDVSEYGIQVSELKEMIDEFFASININDEGKKITISYTIPSRMIDFMVESLRKTIAESYKQPVPDSMESEVESDWQ